MTSPDDGHRPVEGKREAAGEPDRKRSASGYGDSGGIIQGNSGILRVSVSPDRALVEYVRAQPSSAETEGRRTGDITHSYRTTPPISEKGARSRP